jgi:hypothetical protein
MNFRHIRFTRFFLASVFCCSIVAVLTMLAACNTASHRTVDEPEGQPASTEARLGIHYFLPVAKIRIVGTYGTDTTPKSDTTPKKDGTVKNDEKPKTNAGTGNDDTATKFFQIKISRVLEPNHQRRYFLENRPHALFDDESTLSVDENGLLQTVNSTSTDQTPAIIESATDIVINLMKIGAQSEAARLEEGSKKPKPFVRIFDPLNSSECSQIHYFLHEMGITFSVCPFPRQVKRIYRDNKEPALRTLTTATSPYGVFYHPPVAVTFKFTMSNVAPDTDDSVTYTIPDYNVIECYSLRRAALVKQQTELSFASGMPKQIKFVRPSQALAAMQIPQKIVAKVAEAIPAIIKIKSEAATRDVKDQTAVVQAQRDYLQAEIDLRKKEAELETLIHANSTTKKETSTGPANPNTPVSNNPSSSPSPSEAPKVQPGVSPNPSP